MTLEQINAAIAKLSASYDSLNKDWQKDFCSIDKLQLLKHERYRDFYNKYKDFDIEGLLTRIITFKISKTIINRLRSLIETNLTLYNQKKNIFINFDTRKLFFLSEQILFDNKLEVLRKDLREIQFFGYSTKTEKQRLLDETNSSIKKLQSEKSGYVYSGVWIIKNYYNLIYELSQKFISVVNSYFPPKEVPQPKELESIKLPKEKEQLSGSIKNNTIYVNMKLASSVHELCNNVQFEPLSDTDFYNLLNNKPTSAKFIIKAGEKTRVYFLIHRIGNSLSEPAKKAEWMQYIFRLLGINEANYNSKYREPMSKHPSKASQKFAEELNQVFQ